MELVIVPRAGHVDLYDRMNLIPWDTLTSFFGRSLGVKGFLMATPLDDEAATNMFNWQNGASRRSVRWPAPP